MILLCYLSAKQTNCTVHVRPWLLVAFLFLCALWEDHLGLKRQRRSSRIASAVPAEYLPMVAFPWPAEDDVALTSSRALQSLRRRRRSPKADTPSRSSSLSLINETVACTIRSCSKFAISASKLSSFRMSSMFRQFKMADGSEPARACPQQLPSSPLRYSH